MLKEAIVIGASAAAGTYITQKFGAPLATQAAKLHIPPMVANMVIVGGFTAISYFVVRKVI